MRKKTLLAALALLATAAVAGAQQAPAPKGTPVLKTTTDALDRQLQYPAGGTPELTAMVVELAPGGETGRHAHPVPVYVYVLEGSITIEFEGGRKQELAAGQAGIEPVNVWQNGKNTGSGPAKVLAVFLGQVGTPVTIRPGDAQSGASGAAPGSSMPSGGGMPHPGMQPPAQPGASPQ